MVYEKIKKARFLSRPNRFVAQIALDGQTADCHVKNTGRCAELLVPNAEIYVQEQDSPARKTKYDLIAVRKAERLINMDSQAPNQIAAEWLRGGGLFRRLTLLRPECRYGDSRFDFYIEADGRRAFLEVKGVTLEENGVVRFPDAPTQRGIKHLNGLLACRKAGYDAYVLFIVQMSGVRYFSPNDSTHPAFGQALREAYAQGVCVLAVDCLVTENSVTANRPVEIRL